MRKGLLLAIALSFNCESKSAISTSNDLRSKPILIESASQKPVTVSAIDNDLVYNVAEPELIERPSSEREKLCESLHNRSIYTIPAQDANQIAEKLRKKYGYISELDDRVRKNEKKEDILELARQIELAPSTFGTPVEKAFETLVQLAQNGNEPALLVLPSVLLRADLVSQQYFTTNLKSLNLRKFNKVTANQFLESLAKMADSNNELAYCNLERSTRYFLVDFLRKNGVDVYAKRR